jgi:hypothetical protein
MFFSKAIQVVASGDAMVQTVQASCPLSTITLSRSREEICGFGV